MAYLRQITAFGYVKYLQVTRQTKSVNMQECVMCNFESKSSIRALAIYQASYSQLKLEGRLQNENEMKH